MPIYSTGDLNTSALTAPDLYVQVVPPRARYINGVATDGLGLVGVASWGPVNSAFRISSDNDMAFFLGTPRVRQYDLATAAAISLQLGAANLNCVRVTNGQDKAASGRLCENASKSGLLLTALYSGTRGNHISAGISPGTAVNTRKLTVSLPGVSAEVFDNLQGEGDALWKAMAEAVNQGQMNIRGPSQLVRANVAETEAPAQDAVKEVTLSGGTDGTTGITDTTLLGKDGTDAPRKGMYALRAQIHRLSILPM